VTEEVSNNDEQKAGQGQPPSAVLAEGQVQEDKAVSAEGNPAQNANDKADKPIKATKVRETLDRCWEFLRRTENTNVITAVSTFIIMLATCVTAAVILSGSSQTDKIVTAAQNIQTALETQNQQSQAALDRTLSENRRALRRNLRLNQRQFDNTLEQMAKQSEALRTSNTINREALESVQRAFVGYHTIECSRGKTGTRIYWSIQPVWENSGNTPALNVVNVYTMAEGRAKIPEEIFKGKLSELPETLSMDSIAPKALQETTPTSLDEAYIFGMDLGDGFENFTKAKPRHDLSIFGWIVYDDVLPKTPPHLTEFCRYFDTAGVVYGNPPQLKFDYPDCPQHNCEDEHCPDYKEIVAFANSRRAH
jgi:hypothetical protein